MKTSLQLLIMLAIVWFLPSTILAGIKLVYPRLEPAGLYVGNRQVRRPIKKQIQQTIKPIPSRPVLVGNKQILPSRTTGVLDLTCLYQSLPKWRRKQLQREILDPNMFEREILDPNSYPESSDSADPGIKLFFKPAKETEIPLTPTEESKVELGSDHAYSDNTPVEPEKNPKKILKERLSNTTPSSDNPPAVKTELSDRDKILKAAEFDKPGKKKFKAFGAVEISEIFTPEGEALSAKADKAFGVMKKEKTLEQEVNEILSTISQ